MSKHEPEAKDDPLPEKAFKELFTQSHDRGRAGLPVMSLSMSRGLVPRDRDERRVETNLGDEEHRLVRAGELAYNMMRMWQGVCSLAEEDCLVSPAYVVVRPLDGMDPKFAEYLLTYEETVAQFKRRSFGVVDDRLRLYYKDFERVRVKVPSPAAQRKIVKILTTLDHLIDKTEALIAKYQAVKQGMMHDLFTRGVDEHGRLRPPQTEVPHLYKPSPIGWLPNSWDCQQLASLLADVDCPMRSGPFGSSLLKSDLVENGIPFLGIDNVHREHFVEDYKRYVTEDRFRELRRYSVKSKDVMITIMGTVGRSCVVPEMMRPALSSKHVWTMTFDQDRHKAELICWQLNFAPWVLKAFEREAQGAVMDAIRAC